jgi:hypothetical protein
MTKHLSTILELVGAGLLVVAIATVSITLAIGALGLCAVVAGYSLGDNQ